MKLGKLPHSDNPKDLNLANYLPKLDKPLPEVFGHGDLVPADSWGVLANDRLGCCVWSGAAHETLVLGREGDHDPAFSDASVEGDYERFTGYNPNDPSTDQGTDMRQAAQDRRGTGISDARDHRHRIGAYLWLEPGNLDQLWQAAYEFSVVGVGYEFPESAMQQFREGQPWDVVKDSKIVGGHYVPCVGRTAGGNLDAVSWGRRIQITPAFYEKYSDAALVYISASALGPDGKTPEGLDKAALVADLAALKASDGTALFPGEPKKGKRPLNPLSDPVAA